MNKIPSINKSVEFKYLDSETFILDVNKGRFYKLDRVGTDIWKLINGKRDFNEIIEILYDKYDAKKTCLEKDIVEFIERGLKLKIISLK